MSKTLTQMAAEIVAAQAAQSPMSPEDMRDALMRTFSALSDLKRAEESQQAGAEPGQVPEAPISAVPGLAELVADPPKSIGRSKVVCLECGKEFKQLTNRHLSDHGLTAREYRKKWGFSARQPLSAKSLTAKRRKNAKDRNLGEMLKMARAQRGKS